MTITNSLSFRVFFFTFFVVSFLSAVSHYAHKLHEIYLLSALEAHEGTKRDIFLFIKLFIFELFFSHRNIFLLYFSSSPVKLLMESKNRNVCNILVFMETLALFIYFSWYFSPVANAATDARCMIYLFIMLFLCSQFSPKIEFCQH